MDTCRRDHFKTLLLSVLLVGVGWCGGPVPIGLRFETALGLGLGLVLGGLDLGLGPKVSLSLEATFF